MTHLSEDTIAAIDSLKRQIDEHEELLASHERLRVALVELDAFCETGYEDGDVIRYVDAPVMKQVNMALKQIPEK